MPDHVADDVEPTAPQEGRGRRVLNANTCPNLHGFLITTHHGRLYIVRDVIGHWRERRAWWREALDPDEEVAARGLDSLEHEVWRVEASPGRLAGTGVYDLGMGGPARSWRLLRVAD